MKKLLLCTFVLASFLMGGVANAGIVTFDFTSYNPGNAKIGHMTVDGYTLQIEAWTANHQTNTNPWTTTPLGSPTITWVTGQGLGVSNTAATGSIDELDTGLYSNPSGWQDFLSFKLTNLPTGATANYHSITYYGLQEWVSDANGEFSQARINTFSGGVLQGGTNPLGTTGSTDQTGMATDFDEFLLPLNFNDGVYYLLAGPRLGGINNSGTAGAGDSFRVAELEITVVPIPGAVWLLASGLVGLVGLRRKFQN